MIKVLFSVILFFSLNAYGDIPAFTIEELYKSGTINNEIKRNMAYFSIPPEDGVGRVRSMIPISDCQEIIQHKFLTIARFPASFGGENIYIAIDSEPMRYFKLWMYSIDAGVYQMRLLKEVDIMAEEEFFAGLKNNYSEFWQDF